MSPFSPLHFSIALISKGTATIPIEIPPWMMMPHPFFTITFLILSVAALAMVRQSAREAGHVEHQLPHLLPSTTKLNYHEKDYSFNHDQGQQFFHGKIHRTSPSFQAAPSIFFLRILRYKSRKGVPEKYKKGFMDLYLCSTT